jgi:hypothetical protein
LPLLVPEDDGVPDDRHAVLVVHFLAVMCAHWLARAHDRVAVDVRGVADELLLAGAPVVAAGRLPIGVGASEREHARVPPAVERADGGDRLLPTATGAVRAESGGTRRTSVGAIRSRMSTRSPRTVQEPRWQIGLVFLVFRPGARSAARTRDARDRRHRHSRRLLHLDSFGSAGRFV